MLMSDKSIKKLASGNCYYDVYLEDNYLFNKSVPVGIIFNYLNFFGEVDKTIINTILEEIKSLNINEEYSKLIFNSSGSKSFKMKFIKVTDSNMIQPFTPKLINTDESGNKLISYGTSSYGYDVRCSDKFRVFSNVHSSIIDPKNFNEKSFVEINNNVCIIPPHGFALASTVERFKIPRNITCICLGKSTYARCGIIVNVTPIEAEWEGYITLEFSNTAPLPVKIYANEGCAQLLFLQGDQECEVSYKDRKGKYNNQAAGPVSPKV